MKKRIAIGHEFYKRFVDDNYYYVDKTHLIKDIFDKGGTVNLFTRPRRFGKTLALTMLKTFFEKEIDRDGNVIDNSRYFEGTKIAAAGEEYMQHMGQYPVIFLTLKSAKQPNFEMAKEALIDEIRSEYSRHLYVLESNRLEEKDKEQFRQIYEKKASDKAYATALQFLSTCLQKYHNKDCIILMDEYDVPLENAHFGGFYDEMIAFIRSLFESSLKTNTHLKLAVITGCLRISRESIFTGLNNLQVISVLNENFAECFGFTTEEVEAMLDYYEVGEKKDEVKHWYNGYLFGQTEVYNPWSIINYIHTARANINAFPKPYWSNTSSNSIVKELIENADSAVKMELENLIAGGTIEKPIHEDITYGDIYASQDNLWNFLFFTGYLKKAGEKFENEEIILQMTIPNAEIRYIYRNAIREWFQNRVKESDNTPLYNAILEGDADKMAQEINQKMFQSISYYDYNEAYYHGFLCGLLQYIDGYIVRSNREKGNGRPDIVIQSPSIWGKAVILELKVANTPKEMKDKLQEALEQIRRQKYIEGIQEEGYEDITAYGIVFYKKNCLAVKYEE